MRYFGGKSRVSNQIAALINKMEPRTYLEPFCGGCWVGEKVAATRVMSDVCKPLITLYKTIQNGWVPPFVVSEEEYKRLQTVRDPDDPMTAFAGFGCSFAGKYFGGYARSGDRNYAKNAKNTLLNQRGALSTVQFISLDYREAIAQFPSDVVYCDPPYEGATKYYGTPSFSHVDFWSFVRDQAGKGRRILVSEYTAPEDFECILSMETRTEIRTAKGKAPRTERVFVHKDLAPMIY